MKNKVLKPITNVTNIDNGFQFTCDGKSYIIFKEQLMELLRKNCPNRPDFSWR